MIRPGNNRGSYADRYADHTLKTISVISAYLSASYQRFLIVISVLSAVFLLVGNDANAGLIVQRPLYLGLDSGLVGYWTFDQQDMSGERAYDKSGNGNTGLLTNGPTRKSGRIGQALNFDGSNDYVNSGSAAVLDNLPAVTISAWIYPRNISSGVIAQKAGGSGQTGGWSLFLSTTGTLDFIGTYTTTVARRRSANNSIEANAWQHVLATWDGSLTAANIHFYINGVEVSYVTTTDGSGSRTDDSAQNVTIGASGSVTFSNGLIDDVRIYNRALSQDEIKRLYNIGATLKLGSPKPIGLDNGLVGYWTFDGSDMAGERAYDKSGNGNTGLLTNGPVRKTGRIGQALNFDGSDDYVDAGSGSSLDNIDVKTVSAWIYPRTWGGGGLGRIADKQIGWLLGMNQNNNAVFYFHDFSTTDGNWNSGVGSVTLKQWTHVAVVYDRSSETNVPTFYINGSLASTVTGAQAVGTAVSDATTVLNIGDDGAGTRNFDGLIDDVRVYNRALSPDEIKRLYNIGATLKLGSPKPIGLDNGLVGYWTFDGSDMAGERAYDKSGNGNTGLLTNGPVRKAGRIGQALNFDGTNDRVRVSQNPTTAVNNWTMTAWVNPSTLPQSSIAVSNGYDDQDLVFNGYSFGIGNGAGSSGNKLVGYFSSSWIDSGYTFPSTNRWYHITVLRDSGTSKFYVDGVQTANTSSVVPNTPTSGFEMGAQNMGLFFFKGLIDEVRVYNRALTPDEIRRLYNMGR